MKNTSSQKLKLGLFVIIGTLLFIVSCISYWSASKYV